MASRDAHTDPDLVEELQDALERRYGPVLGGGKLASALGFASNEALRQARRRGQVSVTLFTLPKRRGHFALARDVARWLAEAHAHATDSTPKGGADPQRTS